MMMTTVRSTGKQEIYPRIADHVPMGSPVLVKDGNEKGKSVLTRQIMYWAMKQVLSVNLFTMEDTTKSFIKQIVKISHSAFEFFSCGYFNKDHLHGIGFASVKRTIIKHFAKPGSSRSNKERRSGYHLNL